MLSLHLHLAGGEVQFKELLQLKDFDSLQMVIDKYHQVIDVESKETGGGLKLPFHCF